MCEDDSGSYCGISEADLSMKTINDHFTFSGNKQLDKVHYFEFQKIGKVDHLPSNFVEAFPSLRDFRIIRSYIPILKNGLLKSQFNKITSITFESDEIQMIEDNAFIHLTNLEELWIRWSNIRSLSARLFQNNQKLKIIKLTYNKIKMIAPQTFENLKQLRELDLGGSKCVEEFAHIGCYGCNTTDHTKLDRILQPCYENHTKSVILLNTGKYSFSRLLVLVFSIFMEKIFLSFFLGGYFWRLGIFSYLSVQKISL
jgi:hypothetical protein